MKKIVLCASIFLCSFTGYAATVPQGSFISTLPLQHATVSKIEIKKSGPLYIQELDMLTPKQKQVLEYAYRVGNDYDIKNAKLAETEKTKRLGYHLAAIAWIESRACENTGKGKKNHHAYGCWQVTINSASATMDKSYPKNTVIKKLETLHGGSKYAIHALEYWLNYHNGNLSKALASYNAGFNFSNKQAREYASMVNHTAKYLEENQII